MLPGPKRSALVRGGTRKPKPADKRKAARARPKQRRKRSQPVLRAPPPQDPQTIPVYIIVRDRVTALQLLVERLERAGQQRIVLVDNSSTYPPLLEYLRTIPHRVVRTGRNEGPWSPWRSGLVAATRGRFIVADPDMYPDETCPDDFIHVLYEALGALLPRGVTKVGMGLRIDDLPDNPVASSIRQAEGRFWKHRYGAGARGEDWWVAAVDSTFALYLPGHPYDGGCARAARIGTPYLMRCGPWYEDPSAVSEEERYFIARASRVSTFATRMRRFAARRRVPPLP